MRSISRLQAADACGQSRFCPQSVMSALSGMDETLASSPLLAARARCPPRAEWLQALCVSVVCLIDAQDDRRTPEENTCAWKAHEVISENDHLRFLGIDNSS